VKNSWPGIFPRYTTPGLGAVTADRPTDHRLEREISGGYFFLLIDLEAPG